MTTHPAVFIDNMSLVFPHKTCFENFSTVIYPGDRIGLIGRNGSGKSTLLKMLTKMASSQVNMFYVPQIVEIFDDSHDQHLSGGEGFQQALTQALSHAPDILLLDEPTNHLDEQCRKNLMRFLQYCSHTLIIATHDRVLLENSVNMLWHIEESKITVFQGNFSDYQSQREQERRELEKKLFLLKQQQKEIHFSLMQEQKRAAKSRQQGHKHIQQNKWPTIVSAAKADRAASVSGKKKKQIIERRENLLDELAALSPARKIQPLFHLACKDSDSKQLIDIREGSVSYANALPLIKNIYFSVFSKDRIALLGNNGSGKSTFLKALLNHSNIIKTGEWQVCGLNDIGYLDQHYKTLESNYTVLETLQVIRPEWPIKTLRRFLADFLFCQNEEVNIKVSLLSGGEKMRLCFAQIAAKSPRLLILDEITNNIDLETKQHLINILNCYPGALIAISHEKDFLKEINISHYGVIKNQSLNYQESDIERETETKTETKNRVSES